MASYDESVPGKCGQSLCHECFAISECRFERPRLEGHRHCHCTQSGRPAAQLAEAARDISLNAGLAMQKSDHGSRSRLPVLAQTRQDHGEAGRSTAWGQLLFEGLFSAEPMSTVIAFLNMNCNQATECTFVVAFRLLDCSEELATTITFGCTLKAAALDHIVQERSSSKLGLCNGECKCSRAEINHHCFVDLTDLSSYTLTTTLQTSITIPQAYDVIEHRTQTWTTAAFHAMDHKSRKTRETP